jgi:pimeloyl-ACP methyl ester carboxylesterase
VEISVAAADGTRLVSRRTGRGARVVLVHGSAGGLDSWDPMVPLLEDRYELWVYARRGYAPSDGCRHPKTYADDVADLRAIIAAAGGSAHLVGASYGATVVLHAACATSEAIRSVTLFEPPLFAAGAALAPVLDAYRQLLDAGDLATATHLFAERVARVPASLLAVLASVDEAPGNTARRTAEASGCLHDLEAMTVDTADFDRWSQIDVPTLLMQGGETWAPVPASMDALAAALPKATRVVLSGQSHFATHTAPELFARALRGFLQEHG